MSDKNLTDLMAMLVFALIGGFIGYKLKIPAGTLIFSLMAVAGLKLIKGDAGSVPPIVNFLSQSLLGLILGSQFNRTVIEEISKMWGYMLLSVLWLVAAGVLFAIFLMKMKGVSFPLAYLSTSPGAMSAMAFLAVDQKMNAVIVAIFHLFRIFFVLLTGPFVLKLMETVK